MRHGLALPLGTLAAIGLAACNNEGGRDDGSGAPPTTMTGTSLTQSPTEDGSSGGTDAPTTSGDTTADPETTLDPTSTGGGAGELVIDPAMSTIIVENGNALPQQLVAKLDGVPVQASWSTEATFLGNIDDNGLVTATAPYGGTIQVHATYEGHDADAIVDVMLKQEMILGDFTDPEKDLLDGAVAPDPAALLAYPYDGMVYPKGLPTPELMWNGTTPGDKYLIHLTSDLVDVKVYTLAEPPSRFLLDQPMWNNIAETVSGGQLHLKIARLKAGDVAASVVTEDTWTLSSQPLIGSVYYWANSLGRVLRINPGALAPEDFLLAGGQDGCSTCHSVSANGKTLILGGDINVSNWNLPSNAAALALPNVGKPIRDWAMAAISADGAVVIENGETNLPGPPGGHDGMWDAVTGMKIPSNLDGIVLDMPAFSANDKKIAFVDHMTRSLSAYDYDEALKQVSNPVSLVPAGADPSINGITFPALTPDGKWIVYHRGSYPSSLDTRFSPGALYFASSEAPNQEVRLGNGNGDAYPFVAGDRDRNWNYEPTFAPRASGGYTWVVFTSRRTYGNRLVGSKDEVKQLWMMAIDENPQPGVDPSHPAFWMPGQDLGTLNMRGFWALDKDDPGG